MKRAVAIVVSAGAAIAMVLVWRCHAAPSDTAGPDTHTVHERPHRIDPRTLARGSISGTVRDERGPIARARVCADWSSSDVSPQLTREPVCTTAGADGRYTLANLVAADYGVFAMAAQHVPGGVDAFTLAAGEAKTGVDVVLAGGGVEVTGTVSDIGGGPIAQAIVAGEISGARAVAESDAQGHFTLWLPSGFGAYSASADGYAPLEQDGFSPGAVELVLTPESSISGVVTDEAGKPRAGIDVDATSLELVAYRSRLADITDEQGRFRIAHLTPGRYTLVARAPDAYGRSDASTLVGLAQHVDGVVIKLRRAFRIEGTVMSIETHQPCASPTVTYDRDPAQRTHLFTGGSRTEDARVVLDGLVPGSYLLDIGCRGHHLVGDKPVVNVVDRDVTGLVWNVSTGGSIRGHVRDSRGAPVAGASVYASPLDTPSTAFARSGPDGAYELVGMEPGHYKISASTEAGYAEIAAEVTMHASIERDFVIEDRGRITGIVVDERGAPVAGVGVNVYEHDVISQHTGTTRADGSFVIEGLYAGDYQVFATRRNALLLMSGVSPGHEQRGVRAHVVVGTPASVKLVIEAETATIRGRFVDGKTPIADAYVLAEREDPSNPGGAASSIYFDYDARPSLTAADGGFELHIAPGTYTVRAYRRGGGDALAEHVATGSTIELAIQSSGTLEGTIAMRNGGAPPDELVLRVDSSAGYRRIETVFHAAHYAIRDLPAGNYEITVISPTARGTGTTKLERGDHATLDLVLDAVVRVTGRLVDAVDHRPIPNIRMFVDNRVVKIENGANVTDANGKFTLLGVPAGRVEIDGTPRDSAEFYDVQFVRTIPTTAAVDLGDLAVVRPRIGIGDPVGRTGVRFDQEKDPIAVAFIDPAGPAAKTELRVGDQVTSVDGNDVTGDNATRFSPLLAAPPGTTIHLGLARGVTIDLVLAAP